MCDGRLLHVWSMPPAQVAARRRRQSDGRRKPAAAATDASGDISGSRAKMIMVGVGPVIRIIIDILTEVKNLGVRGTRRVIGFADFLLGACELRGSCVGGIFRGFLKNKYAVITVKHETSETFFRVIQLLLRSIAVVNKQSNR